MALRAKKKQNIESKSSRMRVSAVSQVWCVCVCVRSALFHRATVANTSLNYKGLPMCRFTASSHTDLAQRRFLKGKKTEKKGSL